MNTETIDLDALDLVTGGAAKPTTPPPKPAKPTTARPLAAHRVGNTKVINNQSLDDMFWEVKPF